MGSLHIVSMVGVGSTRRPTEMQVADKDRESVAADRHAPETQHVSHKPKMDSCDGYKKDVMEDSRRSAGRSDLGRTCLRLGPDLFCVVADFLGSKNVFVEIRGWKAARSGQCRGATVRGSHASMDGHVATEMVGDAVLDEVHEFDLERLFCGCLDVACRPS